MLFSIVIYAVIDVFCNIVIYSPRANRASRRTTQSVSINVTLALHIFLYFRAPVLKLFSFLYPKENIPVS